MAALHKAATVYYWAGCWLFWVAIVAGVELGIAAEMTALSQIPIRGMHTALMVTMPASVLIGTVGLVRGIKKCIAMLRTWAIILVSLFVLLSAVLQLQGV